MKKSYKKLLMFVIAFMFLLQTTAFGIGPDPEPDPEPDLDQKLTVQVEAPDTGTVDIDVSYSSPEDVPDPPITTLSAITTDEWEFIYDPDLMEGINVTCSAIESDGAYFFDHWEMEYINDNVVVTAPFDYNSTLSGSPDFLFEVVQTNQITVSAIFLEAPKLTVQVEAPNTGTIKLDAEYDLNSSPELPTVYTTYSALTTDEQVFYYNPKKMQNLNITCCAIESEDAYYFSHWDVEYLNDGVWSPLQVSTPDFCSISISDWDFGELRTKHISASAIFVEAPTLTVQVESPNTGTVEIDGIIGEYNDPIYAPPVNQLPQYGPVSPVSIFPASTTDEWVFYYNLNEMHGFNVTCSAINSKANYYFDHWSLEYLTEEGWKSPIGFDYQSDTLSNFAWIFEEMRTDQVRVTAYFKYDPPPTPRYTLTIDSTDGGSVNFEGSFTRDSGTMFDLELFEEEGYEFIEWIGDTDALNSDGDVVLYKDTSLTAVFEKIQEEVIEEEEPEEPEEEILDEEVPEAPTPETGGMPFAVFGGTGVMLIGVGAILRKRYRR